MTPSRPAASKRSSQPSASSRSRVRGRELEALRAALEPRAPLRAAARARPRRPSRARTSNAMKLRRDLGRQLVDAALGRMEPHLHRVEVEHAVALDHDLAVERGVRRQQLRRAAAAPGSSAAAAARSATRARSSPPSFSSTPRKPSHFGSYCQSSPVGQLADELGLHRREGDRRVQVGRSLDRLARTDARSCHRRKLLRSRDRASRRRHRPRSRHAARARRAVDLGRGGRRARAASTASASFDASELPGAHRRRGQGLRAGGGRRRRRRRGGSSATSLLARRRGARGAGRTPASTGVDPARVGILVGSAIGGVIGIMEQDDVLRERGPDRVSPYFLPNVLVDSASGQIAISLGLRGPNYAPVSACATGSHAVGEGAEMIRRGDADVDPRRRHRGVHAPADPRRLLRDARPRRRGGGPAARVASVRRDARRAS